MKTRTVTRMASCAALGTPPSGRISNPPQATSLPHKALALAGWALAGGAAIAPLASPLRAHHAFAAEFDIGKPLKLQGVVTEMEWINPHAWIHLDVKGPDGKVTSWMVEGGSPNILLRRGFTKKSLEKGTEVVVEGYQAKNGENRANGANITFKDGKRLFLGGSSPEELPQK